MPEYINISKITFFEISLQNRALPISPIKSTLCLKKLCFAHISIFRGKGRYFEITLKKNRFLPIFPIMSRFRGKRRFFQSRFLPGYTNIGKKIVFWPYFRITPKILIFVEKYTMLDLIENTLFWPYEQKYPHFEERTLF